MRIEPMEIVAVFLGGLIAGVVLAFVEKTWPSTGVTTL
jgi:hypothetical protein